MAHQATFDVKAGDRVPFVLSWKQSHLPADPCIEAEAGAGGNPGLLVRLGPPTARTRARTGTP